MKAVFDPANFVQCGVDTLKAWEMLKNKVEYLHIKDAVGQAIVPAGEGEGNIKELWGTWSPWAIPVWLLVSGNPLSHGP